MMKNNNFDKINFVFNILLTLISIIFALCIIPLHEAWRDEAQAWLIAKDTGFFELFDALKYEGHPALWYLILKPFAKLGMPYITINYISCFFAGAGLVLFIFKAPFNKFVKTIVALSPIFIYWLPVVARSYSLAMFLMLVLAYLYDKRKEKPILYGLCIALLVNVHILVAGFCGALLLIELIDIIIDCKNKNSVGKHRYIGFAVGFTGCLLMVIQMWGSLEINGVVKIEVGQISYIAKACENILVLGNYMFNTTNQNMMIGLTMLFFMSLIVIFIVLLPHFRQLLTFVCGVGFNLLVIILLFMPTGQKSHLIIVMLLFIAWTAYTDIKQNVVTKDLKANQVINVFVVVLLLATFVTGYKNVIISDIRGNFSVSKETAEFLKENVSKDSVVITIDDMLGAPVVAYAPDLKYWNLYNEVYGSYALLNIKRAYAMTELEAYMNECAVDANGEIIPNLYKNSVIMYMQNYISENFQKGTEVYVIACHLYYPRFDMESMVSGYNLVFEAVDYNYYTLAEGYKVYKFTA